MAEITLGLEPLGDTPEERVLALAQIVARHEAQLTELRDAFQRVTHVAPVRPREGMIRFADGTDWNPSGDGTVGYHQYAGGTWIKM